MHVVTEPTAWLRVAAERRARELWPAVVANPHARVIAQLAGNSWPAPGSVEDRTCDRCGVYVPPGQPYVVAAYWVTSRLALGVGLCDTCGAKESPEHVEPLGARDA
jgi:hypothetical protein